MRCKTMILNGFRTKEVVLKVCISTVLLSICANALFFNGILVFGSDLIILLSLAINALFLNKFLLFQGAFYA